MGARGSRQRSSRGRRGGVMATGIRTPHGRTCGSQDGGAAAASRPMRLGSTPSATARRFARRSAGSLKQSRGAPTQSPPSASGRCVRHPRSRSPKRPKNGSLAPERARSATALATDIAERHSRLRGSAAAACPARTRWGASRERLARRPSGVRRAPPGQGPRPEHHPNDAHAAKGDLQARARRGR
jgi:hypothetical protein